MYSIIEQPYVEKLPAVRISLEELRAGTRHLVVTYITVCVLTTGVIGTGIDTSVFSAGTVSWAVSAGDTFSSAALQRVTDVVVYAGAHGAVVLHAAIGVGSAG